MNVLICASHSIEEFDQVRLLDSLGYGVFSIGGYIKPSEPHDPKRPALPDVPYHPELHAAVDALASNDNLGNAQSDIPQVILDWLGDDGAIIFHHNLGRLFGQWTRLSAWRRASSGRRIIWRTVGQSVEGNERDAAPYRADGLEIVRYSPKERNIPGYAGEDALIRFYKDPADWYGWTGEDPIVIQFVQNFRARDVWCNRGFFEAATDGLPRAVYGPQSDELPYGGGLLGYDEMRQRLRTARVLLYTGTQPASYTLGLIEALMTGIPVVSIGPMAMGIFPYGHSLFEGHELVDHWSNHPIEAGSSLRMLLNDPDYADLVAAYQRRRAIETFGRDTIGRQWADFLG